MDVQSSMCSHMVCLTNWAVAGQFGTYMDLRNGKMDLSVTWIWPCVILTRQHQCLLCTLPWLSIQTMMTWILATPIISLAHLMACVSQGRSYGKFTVFYLFINILCLFQSLEFKSHGLMAIAINVNRLAEVCSHSSYLWELAHEHVTMLCLSPEQHMSKGFSDLLKHKPFWNQFCALRVDEIHLLYYLVWASKSHSCRSSTFDPAVLLML